MKKGDGKTCEKVGQKDGVKFQKIEGQRYWVDEDRLSCCKYGLGGGYGNIQLSMRSYRYELKGKYFNEQKL